MIVKTDGSFAALLETGDPDLGLCVAESEWEHRLLARRMRELGAVSVWTSGHVCDRRVSPRCFTQPELQPRIVFGWFWAGTGRTLHPTNSTPDREACAKHKRKLRITESKTL